MGTGAGAGVDSAWEQIKLEATRSEMLAARAKCSPQRQEHHERAGLIFHARTSPYSDKRCEKVFFKKCLFFTVSRLRSGDALLGSFATSNYCFEVMSPVTSSVDLTSPNER